MSHFLLTIFIEGAGNCFRFSDTRHV